MQFKNFLTLAAVAGCVSLSQGAWAAGDKNASNNTVKGAVSNSNYKSQVESLKDSEDYTKIIVNTLFSNASPEEKAKIEAMVTKYAPLQDGFGDRTANAFPKKDEDVMKNIKSHDIKTIKSQNAFMEKSVPELRNLPKVAPPQNSQKKKMKP